MRTSTPMPSHLPALRVAGALALAVCLLAGAGPTTAEEPEVVRLQPMLIGTAGESRCPPRQLSAPGVRCPGFDIDRDVRTLDGTWTVGYANNPDLAQKHVFQTVTVFDLAPLRAVPAEVALGRAVLSYRVAGVARHAPSDEPSCNTQLGIPADGWAGGLDGVVPISPAAVAGVQAATLGSPGTWDVTPQVEQWLAGEGGDGAFVLHGDDESPDVTDRGTCLTYVSEVGLAVELSTRP